MKKILSIILSITMLLSMGTVAFAEEATTSGAREVEGIIKVGTCADFAPFEYMENDKMLGFDIDLMNYIAARIGYGVEFVNMSFDKLIPAVDDFLCGFSVLYILQNLCHLRGFLLSFCRQLSELQKGSFHTGLCLCRFGPFSFFADIVAVFPTGAANRFDMGGRKPVFDRSKANGRMRVQKDMDVSKLLMLVKMNFLIASNVFRKGKEIWLHVQKIFFTPSSHLR